MPALSSKIDIHSDDYAANRDAMLALVQQVDDIHAKVLASEAKSRDKYHGRGQLLPRERINRLLDRGSPFLELCSLTGYKMHDDKDGSLAGGNMVTGIGYVRGLRCLITASQGAVKGGTMTPASVDKAQRCFDIAYQQKLPIITLVESGGANLLYQSEIFVRGGRSFANQARASAAGIPQITIVHGSSTAGGAYMPGLSDYVIMVKERAKVFLAGPPLLKAATGEIATDQELGGAEMHAEVAGTTEYLAEDDADAMRIAREIVGNIAWNRDTPVPALPDFADPLYPPDQLAGAVPVDYRQPYDCREVIARIADGSEFLEFKADYDRQTICGHASVQGMPVGFIGNNGPITAKGAVKAAQFIQLLCQSEIPIVFLQNTTGYMVGTEAEQSGIVKHGSKMIQAVANAHVPKITLILGGSFGAGNYGMCGRGFGPDFIFAWPNSRTAVMGGEQAAKVMEIVTTEKFAKMGQQAPGEFIEQMTAKIVKQFDEESTALVGTARMWDDGLIDPRDTRRVLGYVLSVCREAKYRQLKPTTFGVARM